MSDVAACMRFVLGELERDDISPERIKTLCNHMRAALGEPQITDDPNVGVAVKIDPTVLKAHAPSA